MMHAMTMLFPSKVSNASFFALLAYKMTKKGHKEDVVCILGRQNVLGMKQRGLIDYQLLPPSPGSHLGCPLQLCHQLSPQCMWWCGGTWSMQWAQFIDLVVENKMKVEVLMLIPIANWMQPNQTSGSYLLVVQSVAGMADGCLPMRSGTKSTMKEYKERKRIHEVVWWGVWQVCVPPFCNQMWIWFILPCSWRGCH